MLERDLVGVVVEVDKGRGSTEGALVIRIAPTPLTSPFNFVEDCLLVVIGPPIRCCPYRSDFNWVPGGLITAR